MGEKVSLFVIFFIFLVILIEFFIKMWNLDIMIGFFVNGFSFVLFICWLMVIMNNFVLCDCIDFMVWFKGGVFIFWVCWFVVRSMVILLVDGLVVFKIDFFLISVLFRCFLFWRKGSVLIFLKKDDREVKFVNLIIVFVKLLYIIIVVCVFLGLRLRIKVNDLIKFFFLL